MKNKDKVKNMEFIPIGVVRSPFKNQEGTPIQPVFSGDTPGDIVLETKYAVSLADLEGFERIWVIYVFDRAAPFRPRVIPYRDTAERGLFSTRAPCRPNPIGLSVVRLTGIDRHILHVAGIDILDGTPVLDIKPYVPRFDSFPGSKAGWLAEAGAAREQADDRFTPDRELESLGGEEPMSG